MEMELDEIARLVRRGESESVEFKRTTSELTAAMRSVCAMLNGGRGGFIFFGVTDEGSVVGQPAAAETVEQIANALRRIEPRAETGIEVTPVIEGRSVLVVRVPVSRVVHTYERVPYERIGNTTGPMPTEIYRRRLVEESLATSSWESQIADGAGIDDLDHREILTTVEEAIRRQRLDDPGTREIEPLLLGMGLMSQGRLLNAALVLFGLEERLRGRYPQCLLRMARFRGTTMSEFDDNRQVIGNAFRQFTAAQRFWIDYLPVAGRIVPDRLERIDEPLYPTEALREALANAICHRDYSIPGDSIGLAIYDDRLEFSSPGLLPFGQTPADLARPHPSRRRNPLIAEVFYRRGIIEQWGRGTLKMIDLCRQANLPEPTFENTRFETIVRFNHGRSLARDRVERSLTPNQATLLALLRAHGPMTLREMLSRLDDPLPERTVQDSLQRLRVLGLVSLSGTRRSARWVAYAEALAPD